MNLFILILIFAYPVWILPRDIHISGWKYFFWYLYLHISCEYYRGTYISWDEPIYIDITICISSVNITEGHTYLGVNIFKLIFLFAYLVGILPRDMHILGWTYLYWYLYLHIWCEYYRGSYLSWDEPIYNDIYTCISSVYVTEGHTYLGMNLFILIFLFVYLLWVLPRVIHFFGWTYLNWYLYLHV